MYSLFSKFIWFNVQPIFQVYLIWDASFQCPYVTGDSEVRVHILGSPWLSDAYAD